jgi:hypothetical protein
VLGKKKSCREGVERRDEFGLPITSKSGLKGSLKVEQTIGRLMEGKERKG